MSLVVDGIITDGSFAVVQIFKVNNHSAAAAARHQPHLRSVITMISPTLPVVGSTTLLSIKLMTERIRRDLCFKNKYLLKQFES